MKKVDLIFPHGKYIVQPSSDFKETNSTVLSLLRESITLSPNIAGDIIQNSPLVLKVKKEIDALYEKR